MLTLPHEINGNSRTLRFDLDPSGPVLWPPDNRTSAEGKGQVVDLWKNEHWHIVPRVGLAYRLDDKTALRGGYGIFTATNQFDHVNVLQLNPPMAGSITVINPALNPVATIQNPVPVALVSEQPAVQRGFDLSPTGATSILTSRTGISRSPANWAATTPWRLGTWERRARILDTSQLNFNSPDPGPGDIQPRRPYPQFNRIRLLTTDGNSTYHALQARFEHRFARGLSFTAAYNWSHMIDDQEDETNGERCRCQDPRHRGINEKASSILDIRHRLVVGYVWELPFTANLQGVSQAVLGGWALGGIINVQSGSPFRIYQSADTQNNDSVGSARPNLVPGQNPSLPSSERDPTHWFNTAAFTPERSLYGNTPRNPLVGPGLNTWNLSAHKAFKMPWLEGHQLEFRGELFNAFNKPQFANPGAPWVPGPSGRSPAPGPTTGRFSSACATSFDIRQRGQRTELHPCGSIGLFSS